MLLTKLLDNSTIETDRLVKLRRNGMARKEPVLDYEQSRKRVSDYFGCDGDFFLKPLLDLEWAVKNEEDFYFLSYWTKEGKKVDAVVVKKGGEPMIFRTKEYTMVVAIDCVKIGFIFRSGKNIADGQA